MRLGERPRSLEGKPNINKPKLHVLSSMYYCFRVIYGSKAGRLRRRWGGGIKVRKWFSQKVCSLLLTSYESQTASGRVFHKMSDKFVSSPIWINSRTFPHRLTLPRLHTWNIGVWLSYINWKGQMKLAFQPTSASYALVPSGLHWESRSRSQTVLEIEFITICFPNDILWS